MTEEIHGAGPRSSLAILLARFTTDFFSHSGHRRQQRHQWREFPDLPPAYRPLPAAAGSDQQLRLWSWAVLLIVPILPNLLAYASGANYRHRAGDRERHQDRKS